jgi:hypothetical protein
VKLGEKKAIAKVLRRAADLVERGWSQGLYARDKFNEHCWYRADFAEKFSPYGAIGRVAGGFLEDVAINAARVAAAWVRAEGLEIWNDEPGRTQAEAVQALRDSAEYVMGKKQRPRLRRKK